MWQAPPLEKLQEAIADPSSPIGMRMRAAYFLRQSYDNAVRNSDDNNDTNIEESQKDKNIEDIVIETLGKGLIEEKHGSLMRHEFAYVMGQLRDKRCCPWLEKTLSNSSDCIMVRHECGEALGAIGSPSSLPILEETLRQNPNSPEIGQTCEIAIDYMKWKIRNDSKDKKSNTNSNNDSNANGDDVNTKQNEEDEEPPMACACMISPYSSIDPAPPHPKHVNLSTSEIGKILLDESLPLFERYRAMFSLRNRGGSDAVEQLGRALVEDSSSALFRHEVAYVLGQMQHEDSIDALEESLQRLNEHAMVRHESAEALGAIEGRWDEVEAILNRFLEDEDIVVRESCAVALDAADYWGHSGATSGGVEEKSDIDDGIDAAMSFVKQKSVTNGANNQTPNNHFNLAY